MMFTQHTKSSHPMTKDALARVMENRNYFSERIDALKMTPKKKPVLQMILEKYPKR